MRTKRKAALPKSIVDLLDENGIRVNSVEEQGGQFVAELEFWPPADEDMLVTIWFDGTPADFVDKFSEEAADFDPDEHAKMWIENMNSVSGVPQSVRALIDDADAIKEFLEDVAEKLAQSR